MIHKKIVFFLSYLCMNPDKHFVPLRPHKQVSTTFLEILQVQWIVIKFLAEELLSIRVFPNISAVLPGGKGPWYIFRIALDFRGIALLEYAYKVFPGYNFLLRKKIGIKWA